MFRKHARIRVERPLILEQPGSGVFAALCLDMSAGGMFIERDSQAPGASLERLRIGDELVAVLERPDTGADLLRLRVSRLSERGVGLVFA